MRVVRIALLVLACLWGAEASATNLLNVGITGAGSQTSPVLQLNGKLPTSVALQGTFTYGSGGTSADAYVQTSLDGGTTWCDVAEFRFTDASQRYVYNLNSSTSISAEYTPTVGTLSANTSVDGLVGSMWRVQLQTVGAYAGTTLRVDMFANRVTVFP